MPRFFSRSLLCACALLCVFALHAQGDDIYIDDEYIHEPGAGENRQPPQNAQTPRVRPGDAMRRRAELSHDFFAGLEIAKRVTYEYMDTFGKSKTWPAFEGSDTTWLFGFNLRKYFGGSLGLGFEMLFMHSRTERDPFSAPGSRQYYEVSITPFLADFDLLFRLPLLPRLLLNAGTGLTFECMFYTVREVYGGFSGEVVESGSGGSQPGYNLKIGAEFFLDKNERLSVTLDGKLQLWKSGFGREKFTIFTVGAGLAYCL